MTDSANNEQPWQLDSVALLVQIQAARKGLQQVEDTVCASLNLRQVSLLLTEDEVRAVEKFLSDFREAYWG